MPAPNFSRLANMSLRGITLASKFLLIFFLARFLEPSQLGLYGLFVATVGYALYLVGFDFYTFTTREIIKRDRHEWGAVIKSQGALFLTLFVSFLPVLSLVFIKGLLPWSLAVWFLVLLVLEYLTQEIGRLLIAMSEQLMASLVLFLRMGIWSVILTVLMFIEPDSRNLDFVFGAWVLGVLAALMLGVYRICQLQIGGWHKQIDWKWIVLGLKVAIPFLVATLAIRGIFTLDKYWIQALAGLEIVGVYVLFMGVCNSLLSFLDAGVFAYLYPALISAHSKQDVRGFRTGFRKLLVHTFVLSSAFALAAWLLLGTLLSWLDNPLYLQQRGLFPWLLLASVLYAIGMIPHYGLYAQGFDKPIIFSHVASLLVFIMATFFLALYWPVMAVPFGLCIAFFVILIWKTCAFFYLTPARYLSNQP